MLIRIRIIRVAPHSHVTIRRRPHAGVADCFATFSALQKASTWKQAPSLNTRNGLGFGSRWHRFNYTCCWLAHVSRPCESVFPASLELEPQRTFSLSVRVERHLSHRSLFVQSWVVCEFPSRVWVTFKSWNRCAQGSVWQLGYATGYIMEMAGVCDSLWSGQVLGDISRVKRISVVMSYEDI